MNSTTKFPNLRVGTPSEVDFGRPAVVLGYRRLTMLVDSRTLVVSAILSLIAAAITLVALGYGDYNVPLDRVVATLFGDGTRIEKLVVLQWRMPRALAAVAIGAALGMSGAIFQSLTRNPLGSPDIIGFNTGAYTGALVVILIMGRAGFYATAAGALVGGVATALLVYLLAFKRGVQGFRMIIVGIAISALLSSVNTWLILKADLQEAMSAAAWGAGTLNGLGWQQVRPLLIVVIVLAAATLIMARTLSTMELGDDASAALGVRPERMRLTMVILGVSLTAVATAVAGPIAFVALAAPQLAKRLTRSPGVSLPAAAAMGAVLLAASDLIAQWAFQQLPVGVVTVCVGGAYLAWLLYTEARRQ